MNIENERNLFEEWAHSKKWNTSKILVGGVIKYLDCTTDLMWQSWQASANREGFVLLSKEISDDMAEVVALKARVCGGGALDIYDAIVEQASQESKDE